MKFKSSYTKALAYFIAIWLTHAILRCFHLGRVNAFGFPLVSKFDWYIFHAFAIDYLWIAATTTPLLLIGIGNDYFKRKVLYRFTLGVYFIFHSLVLLGTVFDHETYRFLGGHLSLNLIQTFGNSASVSMLFKYVSQDLSIKYLPYVLFLGSVPLSFLLFAFINKHLKKLRRVTIFLLCLGVSFWVFKNILWRGGFRERKLKPLIFIAYDNLSNKETSSLSPETFKQYSSDYHTQWQEEQGDSAWVFASPQYPYIRTPVADWCTKTDANSALCTQDKDQDGFKSYQDCDDSNPNIHPHGQDIPSNGFDEDCNGKDSIPWNIALIFLETHRAVNAGFLKPYGAFADGTPFLNELSKSSHVWTRFNVSGLPTVAALVSTHLSTLQHPKKFVASAFPTLNNQSFVNILRDNGYQTHFFSAADPSWDNQTPWLTKWYQNYSYSRSRETDAKMFEHMGTWLKKKGDSKQPFFVSCITKTNHYPFNTVEGIKPHTKEQDLQARMLKTMNYTEEALKKFITSLKDEAWFSRTLFVIMADHGFSLGSHGSGDIGNGLYSEHTWIPFLINGNHPRLGAPTLHHYPASQADIGPTLLDLAGIKTENHFMGHSLLRKGVDTLNTALVIRHEQGMWEKDRFRIHSAIGKLPRIQGDEIFDGIKDRRELHNLLSENKPLFKKASQQIQSRAQLNTYILENNFLWKPNSNQ